MSTRSVDPGREALFLLRRSVTHGHEVRAEEETRMSSQSMTLPAAVSPPVHQGGVEHNKTNHQKLAKLRSVLDGLLREILVPGFHGVVTVKFTVQDGTIQIIEECVERKHR